MVTSPQALYQLDLDAGVITSDASQAKAVKALSALQRSLIANQKKALWRVLLRPKQQASGIYLWGTVGTGKTYLMDLFFKSLPFENKLRVHFHQFMKQVHDELTLLQGTSNPLQTVAEHFAARASVVCFDECVVNDIADAMLLGPLLQAFVAKGIVLVLTSNVTPDDLYKKGLQRQQFLAAIACINTHCKVLEVDSHVDYRLRTFEQDGVYYTPCDESSWRHLANSFQVFAGTAGDEDVLLSIEGRPVKTVRCEAGVVWFDFKALCEVPRSQHDYLKIAERFHTVLISSLPVIHLRQRNLIRNFINLIDVLYDNKIRVVLAADAPITEIYPEGDLHFEFQRTISRITHMQSREWFDA